MDARSLHNSAILKLDCCDISNTEPSPVETALAGWIALPADRRGGKPSCPEALRSCDASRRVLGAPSERLRPEKEDFVLPAGRYALVIKGQAYDFTVAGPITDAAQCLERVDAANGTFYAECGRPNEKRISSASRKLN